MKLPSFVASELLSFVIVGSLSLVAADARADDVVTLDPEPRPATVQRGFQPPQSLDEYRSRLDERRLALRSAREHDVYARAAIESDISLLKDWYQSSTRIRSPAMFGGGIAMVVVGGGSFIAGATMELAAGLCIFCSQKDQGLIVGGAALMIGGGVVALSGIPLMVLGRQRELAVEVSLFMGPTSGIQGTF